MVVTEARVQGSVPIGMPLSVSAVQLCVIRLLR